MMIRWRSTILPGVLIFCLLSFGSLFIGFGQTITNFESYQQRRAKVLAELDSSSVAVLYSGEVKMRVADVPYRFRVENNFYYLTGCTLPSSILLLIPAGISLDGKDCDEVLFLRPRPSGGYASTTGEDSKRAFAGFKSVLPLEQFADVFAQALIDKKTLYVNEWTAPGFVNDLFSGTKYFLENEGKKALKKKYPSLQFKSLSSLLEPMRRIKSPAELELMQRAIDITCSAFAEAARSAEPGMFEYELQAVIEYVFRRNGAAENAFPCIIGSGPNSLILHYDENKRRMQDGDLVVIDIGAEYQHYCADLTRTIPVNGSFSPEQKLIYEIVLQANCAVIDAIKPGITINDLDKVAQKIVAEGLRRLGLLKTTQDVGRFLPHGVSHPLGLQAHDVGQSKPLESGMVITVEPGIYIAAGSEGVAAPFWNIGIRIEDDVLVTETGCSVLTAKAPKTIEGIEKLMKQKGIGNKKLQVENLSISLRTLPYFNQKDGE